MKTVFVVIKEWGEYSDHGEAVICGCTSKELANDVVLLMKEIALFSEVESFKLKEAYETHRLTLGYKPYPQRPYKTTIDPKNLISQKDWMKDYIDPYNKLQTEASKFNVELDGKLREFERDYLKMLVIPAHFHPFEEQVAVSAYHYHNEYTFSVQEIPVLDSFEGLK